MRRGGAERAGRAHDEESNGRWGGVEEAGLEMAMAGACCEDSNVVVVVVVVALLQSVCVFVSTPSMRRFPSLSLDS